MNMTVPKRIQLFVAFIILGGLLAGTSFGNGEFQWVGSWPYGSAEAVTLDRARSLAGKRCPTREMRVAGEAHLMTTR